MKPFLLTLTAIIIVVAVQAQSPALINYQGVARNPAGNAITFKNIKLRLSIHDINATGAVVYSETRAVTTNAFGLFNVAIGSAGAASVTGTLAGVNWGSGNKYLEVEIDPEGGSLFTSLGTSQLLSVPYALFAAQAAPGGPAGGDLTGTYPNPVVAKLQGKPVTTTTPTTGQVLGFNGSAWTPITLAVSAPLSLVLPYSATDSNLVNLFSITNKADGSGLEGVNASSLGSVAGIIGRISSTTPGGFSAGVRGINNGTGGLGIGVWGSQNGSGWGVYGTTPGGIGVYGNSSGSGTGVFAISVKGIGLYATSNTGIAGRFDNTNNTNTVNTLEVETNGTGDFQNNKTGNAASFLVTNLNSVAAGVRAEIKTQYSNFGAAAVFGIASGTGGYAGLFHASNMAGNAPALVALSDGNGNAITASAGRKANGIEVNVDGTGAAIYGWVTTLGKGRAARFANYNDTNAVNVVDIQNNGPGNALFINHIGNGGNIALFQSYSHSVARINKDGKGFFNGGTQNSGADLAEAFDVEGDVQQYEPGDVLVIGLEKDRAVAKSTGPYSTLVLGVYATKPGVLLTEENVDSDLHGKVPMGVIGVIPTKVCLEGGAIQKGDLLVTSSIPGVAMKADIDKVKPGQVIGKSLENCNSNTISKIKVFVSCK